MIKAILAAFALILCIWGLCELLHSISLLLNCPNVPHKSYAVIWLQSGKAWQQLRFARLQMRWLGVWYAENVIAVTSSITPEETALYQNSFTDNFIFCPAWALENVIRSISGEQENDGRPNEQGAVRADTRTDRTDYIQE